MDYVSSCSLDIKIKASEIKSQINIYKKMLG